MTRQTILTPVGRIVWGSMYEAKTTDYDGNPLTIKNGPDAGKPTQRFEFGLAIAKGAEQRWGSTPWGATIWAMGQSYPNSAAQRPDFAWKVTDGDSTVPGKPYKGRPGVRPCDKEGYPGHWVLSFSSSFMPRLYNADGSKALTEPGAIKPGYYVQVSGSVDTNTGASPGIYLNHDMVALAGYGDPIVSGPDPTAVGFGKGVSLPLGASATPKAGLQVPVSQPGAAPTPVAVVPPPATVQPHPGFLYPPAGAAAPSAPAPAPLPPMPPSPPSGPQMTAKAGITSYAAFISLGWTEPLLRQEGYIA